MVQSLDFSDVVTVPYMLKFLKDRYTIHETSKVNNWYIRDQEIVSELASDNPILLIFDELIKQKYCIGRIQMVYPNIDRIVISQVNTSLFVSLDHSSLNPQNVKSKLRKHLRQYNSFF